MADTIKANDSPTAPAPPPEAIAAAKEAGLRYVTDNSTGLGRVRTGKSFRYRTADGKFISDPAAIKRIRQLAIPPAWAEVWICPSANGHIQATGRDVRKRKQYRYHADWRATRDATKFEKMIAFGQALPAIRRRVANDLRSRKLTREKVLATMVRLLEATLIRVGNEEYAKSNQSYGLSTLRNRHVSVERGRVHFEFKGKSGKKHAIDLHDARMAAIVRQLQDLPGQELFQYLDETDTPQKISSEDVNEYLRAVAGSEFSAKDFRTWAGTTAAAIFLWDCTQDHEAKPTKKNLLLAIEQVSQRLGNTPSICRKSYIHPAIMDGYLLGETIQIVQAASNPASRTSTKLNLCEKAVLAFLKKSLRRPKPAMATLLRRSQAAAR